MLSAQHTTLSTILNAFLASQKVFLIEFAAQQLVLTPKGLFEVADTKSLYG